MKDFCKRFGYCFALKKWHPEKCAIDCSEYDVKKFAMKEYQSTSNEFLKKKIKNWLKL